MIRYIKFKALLQRNIWLEPAYVGVDDNGVISYLSSVAPDGATLDSIDGLALPGFTNGHSHAFQYAMAGLAEEHAPDTHDDFWSWREAMYHCALSVDPDQMEAIAAMLYAEMLQSGYTRVVEFHYLHHDPGGRPYANIAEMGERLMSAASTAGIGITLVPVFYQKGGFGQNPQPRQRRFISASVDDYFKLLSKSRRSATQVPGARAGFSIHSLRAVDLPDIVNTFKSGPADLPFHLHIAEQKKEIDDCMTWCGKRPVQWLLDNLPVDQRFNLVHATHLDQGEITGIAASGATVVLCPSTEGNLGDGIFQMKAYCAGGGRWTIGTDSHIGLNPMEELRMIDYRQRLITHQRNTFPGNAAYTLINESTGQGRISSGDPEHDHFTIGGQFNAVVYDAAVPLLQTSSRSNWLATIVYAPHASRVYGTFCLGKWQVRGGTHHRFDEIRKKFAHAMREIAIR